MSPLCIRIHCDPVPFQSALAELLEQLADVPREVVERFAGRFDALAQHVRIDQDQSGAAGAGDVRIVLQPADALLELVAALRAGQLDVG